ncbi:MAG: response regulator [Nitrospirae bacterium]|nr:response regulator [Nitrospirota bacterium]
MERYNILIVDDEPNVISSLKRIFIDEPYDIYEANSASEGLAVFEKKHPIHVVISDERMPEVSGSEFLAAVRNKYPRTIRILLTGYASIEAAMKAINKGEIFRFFTKPWEETEIRDAVRAAIVRYNIDSN